MLTVRIKRKPHHEIDEKDLIKIRPIVTEVMRLAKQTFYATLLRNIRVDTGMTMGAILTGARLSGIIDMNSTIGGALKSKKGANLFPGNRYKGQRSRFNKNVIKGVDLGEKVGIDSFNSTILFDGSRCSIKFTWYYTVPQHVMHDAQWQSLSKAKAAMLETLQTEGKARLNEFYKKFIFG